MVNPLSSSGERKGLRSTTATGACQRAGCYVADDSRVRSFDSTPYVDAAVPRVVTFHDDEVVPYHAGDERYVIVVEDDSASDDGGVRIWLPVLRVSEQGKPESGSDEGRALAAKPILRELKPLEEVAKKSLWRPYLFNTILRYVVNILIVYKPLIKGLASVSHPLLGVRCFWQRGLRL